MTVYCCTCKATELSTCACEDASVYDEHFPTFNAQVEDGLHICHGDCAKLQTHSLLPTLQLKFTLLESLLLAALFDQSQLIFPLSSSFDMPLRMQQSCAT